MMIGDNGIYRLYRLYPGEGQNEQRLVGKFAIVAGLVHPLEDHDGALEDILPKGKLTGWGLHRMIQMAHSAYWRLVMENDIQDGLEPDLLPEAKEK
jgi:hypothetical protein